MKILHLSTGVSTQSAVYRLHKALLKNGIESYIYCGLTNSINEKEIIQNKSDLGLKIKSRIERLLFNFYPNREQKPWNIGSTNNVLEKVINEINPDIIHLHWINQFVSIKQIAKFKKPIVWTLHDSWAFTGGCHIPFPCEKYKSNCEECPQLNSKRQKDLSYFIFNLKRKAWTNVNIHIIGPSKWMTDCAKNSSLLSRFETINIPNCIDTDYYSPRDKILSRQKFNIPLDKKVILFGAINATKDKNKGFDLLIKSFELINKERNDTELVVFGSKEIQFDGHKNIREIGFISNPELFPYLYSAADVVVNTSRSENFSNVILESLSCGIQVVAFDIGGNSDLISESNGKLISPFDEKMMANGIIDVLNNPKFSENIHADICHRLSLQHTVSSHVQLFNKLLIASY